MNWSYLGVAALLPLLVALAATVVVGVLFALRLHAGGGSSRVAFGRFSRAVGLTFPVVFLLTALWDGRATLMGVLGAACGRVEDQRAMGILRAYGEGFLAKDPVKAVQWYRRAAEGGDPDGQLLLARSLLEGAGAPRDPAASQRWAELAAKQGHPHAMLLLGDLLAPSDPAAGSAWYLQALQTFQRRARQGDGEAALGCGSMHRAGKGVPRDAVEGLAWLLLADQLGLHPMRSFSVKLAESGATPDQRAEARQRMQALQREVATGRTLSRP